MTDTPYDEQVKQAEREAEQAEQATYEPDTDVPKAVGAPPDLTPDEEQRYRDAQGEHGDDGVDRSQYKPGEPGWLPLAKETWEMPANGIWPDQHSATSGGEVHHQT